MNLIEIKQDVFDIAWRIRQIDSDYKLYYNQKQKRYEVHSHFGLEVVVPYPSLDTRTISHIIKTRLENREKLICEIEENNERIEREQRQKIIEKALFAYEEQL